MRSTLLLASVLISMSCRATSKPDSPPLAVSNASTPGVAPTGPLADVNIDVDTQELPPFRFLYVESVGPYEDVGAAFDRVDDYIARRDIRPAGTYCGIYFDDPTAVSPERCHAEVGVAVADDVMPDPPFLIKEVKPGFVASTRVHGADGSAPAVCAALHRWISSHGYRAVGPVYEMVAPIETGDDGSGDAGLETQIFVPIAR
ncbi:MAG: GyrI-like domain-containing protein [Planctomycetes bacterium]|nr:GyrI-like domain-containing protein [Planctomycetota bacterium]